MIVILGVLLSITGSLLVANKKIEGFYLWIISNILWIVFFGFTWTGFMFGVNLILSIYSIYEWKYKLK